MNFSIRAKIISGFALIYLISAALGAYGLYALDKISRESDEQVITQSASLAVSAVIEAHYIWRHDLTVAV